MIAIETKNLTKIYRKSHLGKMSLTTGIKDLSISINKGEIFGLLGLNGSGKTTTIKLLLGLLTPTSGESFILGEKIPSTKVLRKIGFMPEVPYFYRYLTASEILRFYGEMSEIKNTKKKVDELLNLVGLTERKDKKLSEYSKGMLQRIAIAQSLLHDPDILIYDEPVSGLDPLAITEMRNLLLKLKSEGKTIFLSSHLISEVEKVSDRVAILAQGSLVRIIEQNKLVSKEGELEKIFISDVSGTSELGRIKI
ncbi:MAG: ABC transporter ATP-binding protein [Elusimicrobia bacterium]|nr:ABC transporter ATP-binding protein [Elusimicrobiota bacterium]